MERNNQRPGLRCSRDQLARIVSTGRLAVVRLPGRRDSKEGHLGTTASTRRVLYAVDDLQRLINESKELPAATTLLPVKKKGIA